MNAPIPRSLRWQIVLALFAIVLVTVSVSWVLALRFTARDFEAFVSLEALDQAREYAQLLEAQFNVRGDFDDLSGFLLEEVGYETIAPVFDETDLLLEEIDLFDWDEVIALELGLPLERYWRETEEFAPGELAERYGSSTEELVAAIMRLEVHRLGEDGWADDADAVFFLSSVLDEAEAYVEDWEDDGLWESELTNPLLHDAPILVIDAEGEILFDGSGGETALDEDALSAGVPIRDWRDGAAVGYVLPARERWEFDIEEATFLHRTRDGLLVGGLIAAAIALFFGVFIARRISRPLTALRESAVKLADGGSADRLPVSRGELGSVSAAFNAMADSLDQQREVRSRMVSDLSHELNTPLSVVQLELEALRDGMQSADEAVDHVLRELDLLRNLAADVGLLAENAAGLLTIQKETVDLTEFLPATAKRWRTQAEAVGIDLRVAVQDSPLLVEADPTRISQALGNLIRNALQHTNQGGMIEIAGARRPVERLGGIWNTICVHDSGSGIEPKDLERIFERSVRGRAHRTGRGLGLTIVRQIVEAHDGRVWAESTPNVGSSFCLALPQR